MAQIEPPTLQPDVPATLARLRGQLAFESPGARGIEHAARNPDCLRLQALTFSGIRPATAAVP